MRITTSSLIALLLLLAGIFFLGFFYFENSPCPVTSTQAEVRGNSLSGIVEEGTSVTLLHRYYVCHPIERNDIVAYQYAGNSVPLLKIVKGLPGDRIMLSQTSEGSYLLLNEAVVTTSLGVPYLFDAKRSALLSLYIRDYHGIIPEHAYLLLGNLAEGSTDSSRFGLVADVDILAKAQAP